MKGRIARHGYRTRRAFNLRVVKPLYRRKYWNKHWKEDRTCLNCQKKFTPHNPRHIYCGIKTEKYSCSWYNKKRNHAKATLAWMKRNPEKEKARQKKRHRQKYQVQNLEKAILYIKVALELAKTTKQKRFIKRKVKEVLSR